MSLLSFFLGADAPPLIPGGVDYSNIGIYGLLVMAIVWLAKIYLSANKEQREQNQASHLELVNLTKECVTAIKEFQSSLVQLIDKLDK